MKKHIVIHGPQGSGKTHIATVIASLFSDKSVVRISAHQELPKDIDSYRLLIIDDCIDGQAIFYIKRLLIDKEFMGSVIYITQGNISSLSEKDFQFIETIY